MAKQDFRELVEALDSASIQSGEKLAELSVASPVLLVFLRHGGCTFCREALGDIARSRSAIEATGVRIVLVHMADSRAIEKLLEKYGLFGVDRICDPEQKLYRAFGLRRGRLRQLLGPKVLWRGLQSGLLHSHGIALPSADSFQLPGVFLIDRSCIVRRFRHRTPADRPDYAALCTGIARWSKQ